MILIEESNNYTSAAICLVYYQWLSMSLISSMTRIMIKCHNLPIYVSHGIEPRLSLLENNMHPTTLRSVIIERHSCISTPIF